MWKVVTSILLQKSVSVFCYSILLQYSVFQDERNEPAANPDPYPHEGIPEDGFSGTFPPSEPCPSFWVGLLTGKLANSCIKREHFALFSLPLCDLTIILPSGICLGFKISLTLLYTSCLTLLYTSGIEPMKT